MRLKEQEHAASLEVKRAAAVAAKQAELDQIARYRDQQHDVHRSFKEAEERATARTIANERTAGYRALNQKMRSDSRRAQADSLAEDKRKSDTVNLARTEAAKEAELNRRIAAAERHAGVKGLNERLKTDARRAQADILAEDKRKSDTVNLARAEAAQEAHLNRRMAASGAVELTRALNKSRSLQEKRAEAEMIDEHKRLAQQVTDLRAVRVWRVFTVRSRPTPSLHAGGQSLSLASPPPAPPPAP